MPEEVQIAAEAKTPENAKTNAGADTPGEAGYARLARAMSIDEQFAIFRRFSHLARQDLLYRQAELVYLEEAYLKCVEKDAASGKDGSNYFPSHWWFIRYKDTAQWAKWLEIREKLDSYCETITFFLLSFSV